MTQVKLEEDVMDILGRQDAQFPTNKSIGDQTADDLLTNSNEEGDAKTRIGSLVVSTTGAPMNISIPHNELVDKMEDIGFPSSVIPTKTKPNKAFTRAKNDLEDVLPDHFEYNGHDTNISIWSDGWYCKHIVAEYIDGTAQTKNIGRIVYDPEKQDVFCTSNVSNEGGKLSEIWRSKIIPKIQQLFNYHRNRHNGKDISYIQNLLNQKTTGSIKLRRAVYFYPATTEGFDSVLEAFRELYIWVNRYKKTGEKAEFYYTPLFNREADRKFISDKLEQNIQSEIESVIKDMVEKFSNDETADQIAKSVLQPALKQMDSKIQQFEAISESKPKIKRKLNQSVSKMDGEAQTRAEEIVKNVTIPNNY